MPLREYDCPNPGCPRHDVPLEFFFRSSDPEPECECGSAMRPLLSRFAIAFSGAITNKYNDRKRENAHQEGHWAYRTVNTVSGKPEAVFIETWQQQKEFCKEQGLRVPSEISPNAEIDAKGDHLQTNGVTGQWSMPAPRLQDCPEIVEVDGVRRWKLPPLTQIAA